MEIRDGLKRNEADTTKREQSITNKAMEEMKKFESKIEKKRTRALEKLEKKISTTKAKAHKKIAKARRETIEKITSISKVPSKALANEEFVMV